MLFVYEYCLIYYNKCLIFISKQEKEPANMLDITVDPCYRYIYPKTYAKFTFCIKSQGHVYDENFLYYCMHLAIKISSYGV